MNKCLAGIVLVVTGGLLLVISLPFVSYFGLGSATLWDVFTIQPVTVTVIALTIMAIALASLGFDSVWLLGLALPIASSYRAAGTGFWLAVAATALMALGNSLLTAGRFRGQRA